jgi:amino acid transporter
MLFVVVAVWFMAMSIARVASIVAAEGSFYAYVKSWAGHGMGLVAAGLYIFGLVIAMGGILGDIAGGYAHQLLHFGTPWGLGLALLVILTGLNLLGVMISKMVQYIIITMTVLALSATTIICLFHADINNLFPFAPHGSWGVLQAMQVFIFGLFGFESAASLFPIVQNASKNIPKALAYAISIVGLLYILFVGSIILAIPSEIFTRPDLPITEALAQVLRFGTWVLPFINIAIVSAISGVLHSMIWSSGSLTFSLLKNMKSSWIQSLVKQNVINSRTSVLIVGVPIILCHLPKPNFGLIFPFVAASIIIAYILTMGALLQSKYNKSAITYIGFLTAIIILFSAFAGIYEQTMGLF